MTIRSNNRNDRRSWYNYYVAQFNEDPTRELAALMATWLLLLMHRDGEVDGE